MYCSFEITDWNFIKRHKEKLRTQTYFQLSLGYVCVRRLPQRRHASELAGFAASFEVREGFFRPAFSRLNLVSALNWFREHCSLEDLEFKMMSRNSQLHSNMWLISHFPWFDRFFFTGEEIANWFDQRRRHNSATPLKHETQIQLLQSPYFFAHRALHHPHPWASRDQDGDPSISTSCGKIGLGTVYEFTLPSLQASVTDVERSTLNRRNWAGS